ncbi:MAG: hypothetical protein LC620_04455, partial [Halobacteriales archaeon]|nr:hypothetical protein [Halobacteriales archaeon]
MADSETLVLLARGGAAFLLTLIAGFVLFVKWRGPVNQTFAVVCVLLAATQLFPGLATSNPGSEDLWYQWNDASLIALTFAVPAFIVAFLWPVSRTARISRWGLAIFGLAVASGPLFDACLTDCGQDHPPGPLLFLSNLANLARSAAALVLALSLGRTPGATGPRAGSVRLVALGLGVLGLFSAITAGLAPWIARVQPANDVWLIERSLGLLPAAAAVLVVAQWEWRDNGKP